MIHFILGIHCHQPVGNFDFVFESAHNQSYSPFLQTLSQFPSIQCTLHYSGILFEWVKKNKPKTHELIASLTQSGQLEIMTGGYFEPILTTICQKDQLGQIAMLTDYIENEFDYSPRGLWLTERIWEPHLAGTLSKAGIQYVAVDDSHLKQSGIPSDDLFQYFITEELGESIYVFPISEKLRYLIPFQEPEKTIDYLKEIDQKGEDQIVVLADDGEKFGDWPGTYDWVYKDGWLKRFFQLLVDNHDWINTTTFSKMLDAFPPKGKVYIPTASYEEMMGWALPTPKALDYKRGKNYIQQQDFLATFYRGGFWRNFLAKYPESNGLYSKMQWVSQKVNGMEESEAKDLALKELWQGQCNCAYWHGEFGGLYLNHLRHAVYQHLIAAENIMDNSLNSSTPQILCKDYNSDGYDEILVSNSKLNAYFTEKGGQLIELDIKDSQFNLLNTLSRRQEAYHHSLLDSTTPSNPSDLSEKTVESIHDLEKKRDKDIERHLIYDSHERYSFIDHFLPTDTSFEQFKGLKHTELGDFTQDRYQGSAKSNENHVEITYLAKGYLNYKDQRGLISIVKSLTLDDQGILANYLFKNLSDRTLTYRYGTEFNFTVLSGDAPDRYYFSNKPLSDQRPKSQGVTQGITHIGLKDDYMKVKVTLEFNEPIEIWRFPIETVSQSVDAYELNYQGSSITALWDVCLKKGQEKNIQFFLRAERCV